MGGGEGGQGVDQKETYLSKFLFQEVKRIFFNIGLTQPVLYKHTSVVSNLDTGRRWL